MTNAAVIEYTWTAVAVAGLLVQLVLTLNAYGDLRVVHAFKTNGYKHTIAWAALWEHVGFTLIHGCFVTLGVRALRNPNVPLPLTSAVLIPVGLFMAASFILVIVGLNEARVRHKVHQPQEAP